uniref:Uncharacterized protein n=1 Tax=Graphocephala atropunctata TaxID=36148 RepID=A0A1B6KAT0_9HEMI
MRYGLVAWGGTTATNLQRVLVLQKRAIRTISGLQHRDSCRTVFTELKILTVIAMYVLETILFAVTKGQTRHTDHHQYGTRNRNNFALPQHHLHLYEKNHLIEEQSISMLCQTKRLSEKKLKAAVTK